MSGLSFDFTDDQEHFRESVSRFARERIAPGYLKRSNTRSYPMDLHAELGSLGILGIGLPEEFGGTGVEDPVLLGIACEEIGAADVNLAAAPVTIGLTGAQLAKGATPAVQKRWLAAMIAGTEVVAFGLTEPEAGSDAASLRATAVPVDGRVRFGRRRRRRLHRHGTAAGRSRNALPR
jgi:cyclohexanecarboxyl-CoA dehydrogenase